MMEKAYCLYGNGKMNELRRRTQWSFREKGKKIILHNYTFCIGKLVLSLIGYYFFNDLIEWLGEMCADE